ncbi:hydrogenase expression/formation protein HupK [Donghicola sp. C2-DW-16]|uniref:Hydrogenase expression/formation protein HupK n=1 Tax=Donghicola mangrovi TaxID=2729614 RepID=A0ABX2PJV7_9RHOB|nr:hydrogenase expression/formation protein HupK [Donghicola mangrovi]NVO29384.1 hydrogenase expression/formation protein HupK [Donghicola mangrovi]
MRDIRPSGLWVEQPVKLPIHLMVIGRPAEEVAETLPRVFNLCRTAQRMAVRAALGLSVAPDEEFELAAEIRREHLVKLCLMLPQKLGLAPLPVRGDTDRALAEVLFGGSLPDRLDDLVNRPSAFQPMVQELIRRFAPEEAVANGLPLSCDVEILGERAQENSVGTRRTDHPLMQDIEALYGRGPLWRVTARALDLEALIHGWHPELKVLSKGHAIVPAARGIYAVSAEVTAGRVTRFCRMTPTDHLLCKGGIMEQTLETLPAHKHNEAALLVEILDPCTPVSLKGLPDA